MTLTNDGVQIIFQISLKSIKGTKKMTKLLVMIASTHISITFYQISIFLSVSSSEAHASRDHFFRFFCLRTFMNCGAA